MQTNSYYSRSRPPLAVWVCVRRMYPSMPDGVQKRLTHDARVHTHAHTRKPNSIRWTNFGLRLNLGQMWPTTNSVPHSRHRECVGQHKKTEMLLQYMCAKYVCVLHITTPAVCPYVHNNEIMRGALDLYREQCVFFPSFIIA